VTTGHRFGAVGILARQELTDAFRHRRQLVLRAATPVLLLAVLGLLGVLADGGRTRLDAERYTIAVEGDLAGAAELLEAIASFDGGRLDLETATHAALAVTQGSDAGLVVPPAFDASAGDDTPTPRLTIVSDATSLSSRGAARALRAAIITTVVDLPATVTLEIVDATDEDSIGSTTELRSALAQVAAALVLIQGAGLVGTAAARMAGRRGATTLVSQLTLPVARSELIAGRGLAEVTLGLVAAVPLLGLLAAVTALGLVTVGAATWAIPSVAMLAVASVAVVAPMVALGQLIGVVARSPQQVAAAAAAGFVLAVIAVQVVAVGEVGLPTAAHLVPLVGPAHVLRLTVEGAPSGVDLLLALAGSAAATAALLAVAARALGREHVALRS
jgi:hypothetical protein